MSVLFFPGLHQPSDGWHFERACISINRLAVRRKPIGCDLLIDSGAFTELARHGRYRMPVEDYARRLFELHSRGVATIVGAAAQDFMCESFMLAKTKAAGASDGSIADHQRLTVERYDALGTDLRRLFDGEPPFAVLPVLQGYAPADYVRHIRAYGARLTPGMWVGVGSVCKRNGSPEKVAAVLAAIKAERHDLRLHCFGVKLTSLRDAHVRALAATADSMAWSAHARHQAGELIRKLGTAARRKVGAVEARKLYAEQGIALPNPNDWREAAAFVAAIEVETGRPAEYYQPDLFEAAA